MVSPIAAMILQRGVANVDHTKLTPQLRQQVFEEAGVTFQNTNRHEDAAHAFAIAQSPRLRESAEYFEKTSVVSAAAAYALRLDDASLQERVAALCLNTGKVEEAKRLYAKAGNSQMVLFIQENFS